ncbi:MAG TPA: hypothetical protein VKA02_09640 [Candidatus Acidoferrum sp.]|nr:hypothetical protein [Candidatus Acidoferrum sp.]
MNWIGIAAAAIAGALAALIAQIAVGFRKERRGLYVVICMILFFCLKFASITYVEPRIRTWEAKREIKVLPFYRELSIYDPETYQKVESIVIEGLHDGVNQQKISQRVGDVLLTTLPKHIQKASDESVVAFVEVSLASLDELDRANPDACYSYLYPHEFGEPGMAEKYLSPQSEDKTLQVLDDVILSAIKKPQAEPDAKKADALLRPVIANLAHKYGSDVSLMEGTAHDASERKKVCEMDADLYRQILTLPPAEASAVVRYLLSPKS